MRDARRTRRLATLVTGLLAVHPAAAPAQLRPLEPLEWRMFDGRPAVSAQVGGGWLAGQRASLAGTEGTLIEAGNWRAFWRTGRVVLEAGGTVQRFLEEDRRFADPHPDVRPAENGMRHDAGDYRILTAVHLTPEGARLGAALRFGTRLPTTDNTTGLDRDATDFFATLAGRVRRGPAELQAEAGLGILGTRQDRFEQDDLLLYALRAETALGPVRPRLTVLGQQVGAGHREIRGNESLGELRLGFRTRAKRWFQGEAVRGYTAFSPRWGVLVSAGTDW